MSMVTVGIVGGTGPFGRGFAARAAHLGYAVLIGSRDAARAAETADRVGGGAAGAGNREAVERADLVVLAVPFEAHAAAVGQVAAWLADRIVLDVTVPVIRQALGGLHPDWAGSSAEATQVAAPRARVVAAFHTVSAGRLGQVERPLDQDVLLCGDDPDARARIAEIIERAGGRPVDVGGLTAARALEGLGAVMASLAARRRRSVGIRLVGF